MIGVMLEGLYRETDRVYAVSSRVTNFEKMLFETATVIGKQVLRQ